MKAARHCWRSAPSASTPRWRAAARRQEIHQGLPRQLLRPRIVHQGMAGDGFLADGLPLAGGPAVALHQSLEVVGVLQAPRRNGGGWTWRGRCSLVEDQAGHGAQKQAGIRGLVVDGVLAQVGLQVRPPLPVSSGEANTRGQERSGKYTAAASSMSAVARSVSITPALRGSFQIEAQVHQRLAQGAMAELRRGMGHRHLVIPSEGAIGEAVVDAAEAHHAEGGALGGPQGPHARRPEDRHAFIEGEEEFLVPDGEHVEEHPVDDADREGRWARKTETMSPWRTGGWITSLRVEAPHLASGRLGPTKTTWVMASEGGRRVGGQRPCPRAGAVGGEGADALQPGDHNPHHRHGEGGLLHVDHAHLGQTCRR